LQSLEHRKWSGRTSGGTFGHGFLFTILKVTPLWLVYFFMFFGVCWFLLAHDSERRSIYRYFRRILGYGTLRSSYMVLLNHIRFGQVIVDRFAFYAKGGDSISVEVANPNEFLPLTYGEKGIIVAGAHFGNLEIAGYRLTQDRKKIHIFAYAGEEADLQKLRKSAFGQTDIVMEYIGNDMSHLYTIKDTLEKGDIVQMMCDRFAGAEKGTDVMFLGHKASFPTGMFRIADMLDVPMVTFFVTRTGYGRYTIYARLIKTVPGRQNVSEMINQYVSHLEDMIKIYPEQWFNYYDFWKEYGN